MKFQTWEDSDRHDDALQFLEDGSLGEVGHKVVDKLTGWQSLSFVQLREAEHILKVAGTKKLFEIRMRVQKHEIRLYGPIRGDTFWLLYGYHKDRKKIPLNVLKNALRRLERFNVENGI
jgi:hypothetical protein